MRESDCYRCVWRCTHHIRPLSPSLPSFPSLIVWQEEIERERVREQMAIERELQRRQLEREMSRQHVILDEDEESLVERLKTLR